MANYCQRVLDDLKVRYAHEPEFIQAATEILTTLKPVIERNEEKYEAAGLLERFVEPERIITFRVPWVDDQGKVQVNRGYRLYFDGSNFPWKLADDFAEDKRWGYPKWKVVLGKLTGKGKKGD